MEVLGLMHDSDEYGVLRWPLKDLAQAVGCKTSDLLSLIDKGVLKGAKEDASCPEYVYTPRSGRKDGTPVTLIPCQVGPIWYSSRMVRDEYVRHIKGISNRFGEGMDDAPNKSPMASPMGGIGEAIGDTPNTAPKPVTSDGSSVSSSSSIKPKPSVTDVTGVPPPENPEPDPIFGFGLAFLKSKGCAEKGGRSFLGLMRKKYGDVATVQILELAEREDIIEPIAWISKALEARHQHATGPPSRLHAVDTTKSVQKVRQETANAILAHRKRPAEIDITAHVERLD